MFPYCRPDCRLSEPSKCCDARLHQLRKVLIAHADGILVCPGIKDNFFVVCQRLIYEPVEGLLARTCSFPPLWYWAASGEAAAYGYRL